MAASLFTASSPSGTVIATKYSDGTSRIIVRAASGQVFMDMHFTSADHTSLVAELGAGGIAPPADHVAGRLPTCLASPSTNL